MELDGGELVWDEAGAGPVVVFLSGGPGDAAGYLRPLAEPLTGRFRCLVPDLRGTGRSVVATDAAFTLDALYRDLDRLRSAAGADRVALVGHSFGATLAVLYAAARPDAVDAVALIGLGPLDAGAEEEATRRLRARLGPEQQVARDAAATRRREAFARGDLEAFKEAFLAGFEVTLPALVLDPKVASEILEARRRDFDHNPAVHAALVADLAGVDQWSAVRAVKSPVLVLYGDTDFEPIGQAAALVECMDNASAVVVGGAAHLPWLDRPELVTEALLGFLGRRS